ncbi:DUF2911 domain-containing protein [uncultured Arcticibacterium sp.]|uniref:DUF2911 domain-containing protein n=1 Tax=uncultured Arcticibacterium sp. TaxID=2173042 RepID=UPI0030F91629
MKKLLLGFAVLFSLSVTAQDLKTPAPSTHQTITQEFALSSIEIDYSRPSMKGRNIFGGLVPFDEKWRTGANAPTTFTFGQDVTVGGKAVKAGKYSVITAPGRSSWEVMLCKDGTSVYNFKEENVVTTFTANSINLPFDVETFTIMVSNVKDNSADIDILWANKMATISVSADIDSEIMSQIDKVMNNDNKPYYAAASYYFENGKDDNKALEWAKKAADAQPEAYWVRHLLAKANAKVGNKTAAIAAAKASMDLAQKAGNMDYVRLNEALIKGL